MTSEDAKKAITKLFQCYNSTGSDTERKIKFTAYWEALSDLPSDAIVDVCRKASRGEIGQPGFLPSAGELYRAATSNIPRRQYPMLEDQKLVISREERARVNQGFDDLIAKLKASKSGRKAPDGWTSLGDAVELSLADRDNLAAGRRMEELKVRYDEKALPLVHDELMRKLGVGMPEGKE